LELISPGGLFSDINTSIIYETNPIFLWYSDYCNECNYAIRISEYDPDIHMSLQEAFIDNLILPNNRSHKYHDLPSNSISFQSSIDALLNLEIGKYYVWQIKRSYATSFEIQNDYSPIYIFEIRTPTKKQVDFSDPYLLLIQDLIGKDDFNLLFSSGGELERFITSGASVWLNEEELHIDFLHLLVNDLINGNIQIQAYEIK